MAENESARSVFRRVMPHFGAGLGIDFAHPCFLIIRKPSALLPWPDQVRAPETGDPGAGDPLPSTEISGSPGEPKLTLSLVDAKMSDALAHLEVSIGKPVLIDRDLAGALDDMRVSVQIRDLPVHQALALVARTHDLEFREYDDHVLLLSRERCLMTVKPDPSLPAPDALTTLGENEQGMKEFRHERSGIVLVLLPGGRPGGEGRRTLIGKYEVTNAQFRRFASRRVFASKRATGAYRGMSLDGDDQPVVGVKWVEIRAYCQWAGLRLPTDAEWAWAVERGNGDDFPWGNAWPPPARAGNFADDVPARSDEWGHIRGWEDGFLVSAPVGSFAPNALGIHDLAGNVWERCEDGLYGGAWTEFLPSTLLVVGESRELVVDDNRAIGFRVAMDPPEK